MPGTSRRLAGGSPVQLPCQPDENGATYSQHQLIHMPCPGGGPSGLTEFSAANGAWEQTATGICSLLENTAASLFDGPPGCYVPADMVAADGHIWFGSNDSVICWDTDQSRSAASGSSA